MFKVGDRVKVLRKTDKVFGVLCWTRIMDKTVGKTYKIIYKCGEGVWVLDTGLDTYMRGSAYPEWVLQKVDQQLTFDFMNDV